MPHFIGIYPDMSAFGRTLREQARQRQAHRLAKLAPLPERVADAMCEIAAVRGSCDMEDLALRFPGEKLTDQVMASAKRIAGRRSVARVG